MDFKKLRFLSSVFLRAQLPPLKEPEIALLGRSNVGKSSLINHLSTHKGIAKVSSTPGKTRSINFYSADDFFLVDLPGYGYAEVSKEERASWGDDIQHYVQNRPVLMLQLVDLRHTPTAQDLECFSWVVQTSKPFIIVFTKADKLTDNERRKNCAQNLALLAQKTGLKSLPHVNYSIKESGGRIQLIKEIEKLWD